MDTQTAYRLKQVNDCFYSTKAASFSQTRQHPWPGWKKVFDATGMPGSILDVASGNLRFQKYANERFPKACIDHFCIDSCDELKGDSPAVKYQSLDIVEALLEGKTPEGLIVAPKCELCTSFGFMHHIPGKDNRIALLRLLVDKAVPGGHVAVSFWQFAQDAMRACKAHETTLKACDELGLDASALDPGDYLIGWNSEEGVYRYCHSFTENEIEALVESATRDASLAARFQSDGGNGKMNAYVVLCKR